MEAIALWGGEWFLKWGVGSATFLADGGVLLARCLGPGCEGALDGVTLRKLQAKAKHPGMSFGHDVTSSLQGVI